jgi:hypothetical protein
MANVDTEGIARARAKEQDNQHTGRGKMGFVCKPGTRGTGRVTGNGTQGGGINRSVRPTPQH